MRRLLVCLLGWLVPDDLFDVDWPGDDQSSDVLELFTLDDVIAELGIEDQ
jgi:hypothetical protein